MGQRENTGRNEERRLEEESREKARGMENIGGREDGRVRRKPAGGGRLPGGRQEMAGESLQESDN